MKKLLAFTLIISSGLAFAGTRFEKILSCQGDNKARLGIETNLEGTFIIQAEVSVGPESSSSVLYTPKLTVVEIEGAKTFILKSGSFSVTMAEEGAWATVTSPNGSEKPYAQFSSICSINSKALEKIKR